MKPLAALAFACCILAVSQTLSLRDEISPQALQLATAEFATMNATPSAHSPQIPGESESEQKLLALAQSEIDAEGDRFTDRSPAANDMKLYYLLRITRETKCAVALASATGKSDNHLLGRAVSCDLLAKTTIGFGKFQGWRVLRDGPPCLDIPNNARPQEVIVAQQKLIAELSPIPKPSNPTQ
jgi:hypothetical protein